MTSHHNTTYHYNGIEIVGGKLNLNDSVIDGVNKLNIGEWSLDVSDEGELCIKNENIIIAKISNNSITNSNIRYERFFMVQPVNIQDCIGLFVSNTNRFYNYDLSQSPNINCTLPTIKLTSEKDPSFIGSIMACEKYGRELIIGAFKSIYEQEDEINRVLVATYGLSIAWICDINGSINNGDYITSSIIPGYGMKQDDDIKHNYTCGKIMHDCNFNPEMIVLQKPTDFDENGPIYEALLNTEGFPITDMQYQTKYIRLDGTKSTKTEYELELELISKSLGKDRRHALKSKKRTVFKACLVSFHI